MGKLNEIEKVIINTILENASENKTVINILRKQYDHISVIKRTYTGVGFYTNLFVSDKSLGLGCGIKMRLGFENVHAEIKGLKHGAGFVLFVSDGFITSLEGYTYDELWPKNAKITAVVCQGTKGC